MCLDLWEGITPLCDLKLRLVDVSLEYILGEKYNIIKKERDSIWVWRSRNYNLYNGKLIGVSNFDGKVFEVFFYSFKDHIAMSQLGITLPSFQGNLGFKIHIFSPDLKRVIIGRRSSNSSISQIISLPLEECLRTLISVGDLFMQSCEKLRRKQG